MIEIIPSILSADFARLADEIARVERGGAHMLHLDVMDGHFVENLTIGPPVVESIRKATRLHLDVHLMIVNPGFGGQQFIPYVLDKVRRLDAMRRDRRLRLPIEIDGGVHLENLAEVVRAGCDWIVTGSAIFHSGDPEATTREMRKIAEGANAVVC